MENNILLFKFFFVRLKFITSFWKNYPNTFQIIILIIINIIKNKYINIYINKLINKLINNLIK